ncbi:MAG: 50S ribosomal protein L13 [Candidatus Latescibacteria bacterium]|jgi:large subunit ribosomal protein L13|nr:50S ribosomal protein L13 [Candidatus Latescibacterota bacterium]
MKTYVTKPDEVQRKWFLIDATDKVLGRLATEVASILRGKKKPIYQPNVDAGDYVIVVNAGKVRLTGLKEDTKEYWVSSSYAGHSKGVPYKRLKERHPERIIEKAVKGMLPHNALGRKQYLKLRVCAGPEHNHSAQKPEVYEI